MTRKTRTVIFAVTLVVCTVFGIAAYGVYRLYSFVASVAAGRSIPDELKEPRVLKGAGLFEKGELYKLTGGGAIEAIREGRKGRSEAEREQISRAEIAKAIFNFADLRIIDDKIVAVGEFGGFIFDLDGNLTRKLTFETTIERVRIAGYEVESHQQSLDNLRVVKLDREHIGFLSFGSVQGVRVFDDSGREVWTHGRDQVDLSVLFDDAKDAEKRYETSSYVLQAAVGDLDNDGISEYVVATKNDGVRVFGRDGTEKWFQPDEFPIDPLKVIDLDGDGTNELAALGGPVRSGLTGTIIGEIKGSSGSSHMFPLDKAGKPEHQWCSELAGRLTCKRGTGELLLEAELPLAEIRKPPERVEIPLHPELSFTDDTESPGFPKTAWMRFAGDGRKHLVLLAPYIGLPRSHLYVFEENGDLVYHELLGEEAETMAVVPLDPDRDALIVGGKDTIWKYSWKSP